MRISDWSSDVFSSDLPAARTRDTGRTPDVRRRRRAARRARRPRDRQVLETPCRSLEPSRPPPFPGAVGVIWSPERVNCPVPGEHHELPGEFERGGGGRLVSASLTQSKTPPEKNIERKDGE